MFGCKHEWKILSEQTTDSKFERTVKAMKELKVTNKATIPWQMCDATRKIIQIVTCTKCGKIKKFETEN